MGMESFDIFALNSVLGEGGHESSLVKITVRDVFISTEGYEFIQICSPRHRNKHTWLIVNRKDGKWRVKLRSFLSPNPVLQVCIISAYIAQSEVFVTIRLCHCDVLATYRTKPSVNVILTQYGYTATLIILGNIHATSVQNTYFCW